MATSAKFILRGAAEMKRKIEALAKAQRVKARKALRLQGEKIVTAAKRDHVPRDLGTLAATGFVEGPKATKDTLRVTVGFGGPAAPYALAIHEHPSTHSPPSWQGKPISGIKSVRTGEPWSEEGRGPKFLERPFNAALAKFDKVLAEELKL